ncbi:MAG: tetratricopeptide repeat protein, partial [Thiohalomonadales bacterium]
MLCSKTGFAALDSPTRQPTQAEASQHFRDAVTLFKTKQYPQAIKSFLLAEQLGMNTAKLYFNLGSAYYKTQQYDDALTAFTKASGDKKLEVLARINIALSLLKLSRPQPATVQLQLAAAKTDKKKYFLLIQNIAVQNRLSVFAMQRQSSWQNSFYIFAGNNDNVKLQNDDAANTNNQPQKDNFLQSAISASYHTPSIFKLLLNVQSNIYSRLKEYNYVQINIEPALRDQFGKWQYAVTAVYQPSRLDGSAYLNTSALRGEIHYKISRQYNLGGSVAQFFYKDASNKAKHLAGDASVQNLFLEYQGKKLNLNIGILAQDEDRNDFYTDGNPRQSYSPHRASLLVEARFNLNPNNFVDLNL